jgi:transmembrane sensor
MHTSDFSDAPAPFERLAQYVTGELTLAEADAVIAWAALSAANAELLESATLAWRATNRVASEDEAIEARVSEVLRRIGERPSTARAGTPVSSGRTRGIGFFGKQTLRLWTGLATAVAAVILAIVIRSNSHGTSRIAEPRARTYATVAGQQAMVTLLDGSRAVLGPATMLSVVARSSDGSLDIYLSGQALFTVVHDQARPFRVHSGNAVTRVLGTTFMVRRYSSDRITRVVVTDGRVSLVGARGVMVVDPGHVLERNMMGTVSDSGHVQVTPGVAVEDYTAWATGQLVFRDVPARDVVKELGRAYGVDIRIADSTLATHPLSWTVVVAQRSLAGVLESLSDVLNAHTVRAGGVITFVPGRSASRTPGHPRLPLLSERQYGR